MFPFWAARGRAGCGQASQAAHPAGTSLCDSREANEASGSANFGDLMHLNAFDMKRPPFLKTFSSDFKKKNYIKYD
jgi:hypothetical protein